MNNRRLATIAAISVTGVLVLIGAVQRRERALDNLRPARVTKVELLRVQLQPLDGHEAYWLPRDSVAQHIRRGQIVQSCHNLYVSRCIDHTGSR